MHAGELSVGVDDVRRLLRAQFPGWAESPISRVSSWGTVNAMFRLGDELLVRLPFVAAGGHGIEREARWLPVLAALLPVPIPELVALGRPDEHYPVSWSILRWLEGREVSMGVEVPGLGERLAEFVVALRSVPAEGAPPAHRGGPLSPLDDKVRECLRLSASLVDVQRLGALWADAVTADPWTGAPVWIHSDLLPGNVLVGEHGGEPGLAAVIDFAGAGIGDPAADLIAAWSVLTPTEGQVFLDAAGVDDATRARGRGWALSQAVIALPYYLESNPAMARQSRRILERIAAEA